MKKDPSRGPSAFRIVMIVLTLAAVWVTVRQLRPARAPREPRPALQINGNPISLEKSSASLEKPSAPRETSSASLSSLADGSWIAPSVPARSPSFETDKRNARIELQNRREVERRDNPRPSPPPRPAPAPSAPRPRLDGYGLSDDLESPSDPYVDFLMSVGATGSDDNTAAPDAVPAEDADVREPAENDDAVELPAPITGGPPIMGDPPPTQAETLPAEAEMLPAEDSPPSEDPFSPPVEPVEIAPSSPSDRPAPRIDSLPSDASPLSTETPLDPSGKVQGNPFLEPTPAPPQPSAPIDDATPRNPMPGPNERASEPAAERLEPTESPFPAPIVQEPAWSTESGPYGNTIIESTSPTDTTEWELDQTPHWELTLREAIEVALSNQPEVNVARLAPSIADTLVNIERGEFDPVGGMSFYGGQDDRLARSDLQTFNASSDFIESDLFRPLDGLNNFFVRQNLQSGGNFEFGFGTNYQRFFPVGADLLVPSGWESTINLQFNQPLLRGRGKEVALRRVLVAKAQTEQARYESKVAIRKVVREVELAYWQLASAHAKLKAADKYVKLGIEFERQETERLDQGLSTLPQQLQTRTLRSDFTVAYQQAQRDTQIAEMKLRTAMGLAGQSYRHCQSIIDSLVNFDFPIRPDIERSAMPISTDVELATAKAMGRPIFGVPRARIQAAQHQLAAAKNSLLPQVDATALYQKSGLDDDLDGSVSTLFNERFDTWAVGLTYQQSAYRRSSKASVRRFQLAISQEQAHLDALANKVAGDLQQFKADLEGSFDTFQARKEQVRSLSQQVEAFNELYEDNQVSLFQRLETARDLQAAEIEAVNVWGQMQAATARYRFARGDQPEEYGVALHVESL